LQGKEAVISQNARWPNGEIPIVVKEFSIFLRLDMIQEEGDWMTSVVMSIYFDYRYNPFPTYMYKLK
jgi:hypothetical protein